jgi:hypothetical protein
LSMSHRAKTPQPSKQAGLKSERSTRINPATVVHPLRAVVYLLAEISATSTSVPIAPRADDYTEPDPATRPHPATALPALDYAGSNPYLVKELGNHLDALVGVCFSGTRAVGQLLALASPEVEGGEVSQDTIEGLGWLLSELGDMGAWATVISQQCMAVTFDFELPARR